MDALEHVFESASRGYHYYQNVWLPEEGQHLSCLHQGNNAFDVFAIALCAENGLVIGHLPRELSRATKFLLDRGVAMRAEVCSQTYRRSPLVQGGLEVPIRLYLSMRPTKLNEKLLARYVDIYNETYEDPGPGSLRQIIQSSTTVVDFNMKSLLPEAAGPKKKKKPDTKKRCMDIRFMIAEQNRKLEMKKDTTTITLDE